MTDRQTLTVRLAKDTYHSAQGATDPLLGINTCLEALVRSIIVGQLRRPAPPQAYGNKMDKRLSLRVREDVWRIPETGVVDTRYESTSQRNELLRDLVYAIAEGRVSARIDCQEKEVNGDSDA